MTGERVAVYCEQCVASGHLWIFQCKKHNFWFNLNENAIWVCVQWCIVSVECSNKYRELWVCDGGLLLADWPPGDGAWPMMAGWPLRLVTPWSLLVRDGGRGRSEHWSVEGEERRVLLTTYRIQSPICVVQFAMNGFEFLSFCDILNTKLNYLELSDFLSMILKITLF